MFEEIEFLRDAAEQLRSLAVLAPEIASELRLIADDLDIQADRLERRDPTR
jgi:hypothetical protein